MATKLTHATLLSAFGDRPFTRAEADAVGVSRQRLRSAVRGGTITMPSSRTYSAGEPEPRNLLLRMQQDLRARGIHSVAGGGSMAPTWNVPVLGKHGPLPPCPPTLWIPPGSLRPGKRNGVHLREEVIPPEDRVTLDDGLEVTTPLRTAVDVIRLARLPMPLAMASLVGGLRAEALFRAGADATHSTWLTDLVQQPHVARSVATELLRVVDSCPSWGIRSVRACLPYVDARLETALESVSWGRFVLADVPLPTPQVWLQGASGHLWRVDFWWEALGIIGEADGMLKYRTSQSLLDEKVRQLDLEGAGHTFFRWGWAHALPERDPLLDRLYAVLGKT